MPPPPPAAVIVLGMVIVASSAWIAWNSHRSNAGAGAFTRPWRELPLMIDDSRWAQRFTGTPKPTGENWLTEEVHGDVGSRASRVLIGSTLSGLCGAIVIALGILAGSSPTHRAASGTR